MSQNIAPAEENCCLPPYSTTLAASFRSMFRVYHHGMNHPPVNIFLVIFSSLSVLKCATESLKIGSQIKI